MKAGRGFLVLALTLAVVILSGCGGGMSGDMAELQTDLLVQADSVQLNQTRWSDLFQPYSESYATGWTKIAIGDLISKNDIAMTVDYNESWSTNVLIIYSLDRVVKYDLAGSPNALAIGDINRDGKNEVVVILWDKVQIFSQTTNGEFTSKVIDLAVGCSSMKMTDINNDGWPEIICLRGHTSYIYIYSWAGQDSFDVNSYELPYFAWYKDFAIGDIDGDGFKDIVLLTFPGNVYPPPDTDHYVYVMFQRNGGFAILDHRSYMIVNHLFMFGLGLEPGNITVSDINGKNEIALILLDNYNYFKSSNDQKRPEFIYLLKMVDDKLVIVNELPTFYTPALPAVADVNGDGRDDIIVFHAFEDKLGVYLQKADGIFSEEQLYGTPPFLLAESVAVGDANNDGKADIVFTEERHGMITLFGK